MSKSARLDPKQAVISIKRLLKTGPKSSKEICSLLKMSQPVFSRLINKIDSEVLITGRASKTQYALKRNIPLLGNEIPIYQISPKGKSALFGNLIAVEPGGFFFSSPFKSGYYPDLPYFLNDLRPSGFLGRLIPRQHPELQLPENITAWSADTVLLYIGQHGYDLIGNLIIGNPSFKLYTEKFNELSHVLNLKDRKTKYEEMAADVLSLGDPGSSAGGEQAKFLTIVGPPSKQVIVKFSPPVNESIGRRRADLLICEHIAHEVLRKAGKKTAQSEIIKGKTRIFLEVERFDRIPPRGRIGIISLESLNLEYCGQYHTWPLVTQSLLSQKKIKQETHNEVRFYYLFGQLIANTDMHLHNLSFFMEDLEIKETAPIYDMLPMLYAPVNEQIVNRKFNPPHPSPIDTDIWNTCWMMALDFWKQVILHAQISDNFRKIAKENFSTIKKLEDIARMLPHKN